MYIDLVRLWLGYLISVKCFSETNFPNKWVKCTNDPSTYAYYGEKKSSVQVSYSRDVNSVGALKETDDMAEGALCNHNRLRAAAGLSPVQWDECLGLYLWNDMQKHTTFPDLNHM